MASFSCQEGRHLGYWWFVGIDTAPLFSYYNDANRYRHTLAGTLGAGFGTHKFRVGPYATVGFLLVGIGARTVWYPFQQKNGNRHGFDLRATVFGQEQFAGQVSLMYTIDLGDLW